MRDAALPVMYHEERLPTGYGILTNWHENLEILWFTKGLGRVIIDNVQVDAEPGDLAVFLLYNISSASQQESTASVRRRREFPKFCDVPA